MKTKTLILAIATTAMCLPVMAQKRSLSEKFRKGSVIFGLELRLNQSISAVLAAVHHVHLVGVGV